MKKIILIIAIVLGYNFCIAQEIKKDTIVLDSTQIEKINNMPMDTLHRNTPQVMPGKMDSLINIKSRDDVDPKKPKD